MYAVHVTAITCMSGIVNENGLTKREGVGVGSVGKERNYNFVFTPCQFGAIKRFDYVIK